MSDFNSICITRQTKHKYYLSIVWNGRRVRIFNGKKIGSNSTPNTLPQNLRLKAFKALEVQFLKAIENGWTPSDDWSEGQIEEAVPPQCILKTALASKINQGISDSYSRKLIWIVNKLNDKLDGREPNPKRLAEFINDNNWTPATRTIIRRHLIAFEKELEKYSYKGSIKPITTKFKTEETLHKPFRDVKVILDDILVFNQKLHLCCLLAYGCLLRPHREIRLLTWGDFAEDLSYVSLSA